jgi:hypothetical protein
MKILDIPQSGSLAGQTSSRNRFGQYRRTRATPVNPSSTYQGAVRARLSANAASWRGLDDEQRAGWSSLGSQMARTDSLGQTSYLTGFSAYVSVNNNLAAAAASLLEDAPALLTPDAIGTATITLTAAAFSIAFTPTPLSAGERLFAYCSPQRSAGRNFEGDVRLTLVGGAATTSPLDIYSVYSGRFGVPVLGNKIFIVLQRYVGGFLSGPLTTSAVVSS